MMKIVASLALVASAHAFGGQGQTMGCVYNPKGGAPAASTRCCAHRDGLAALESTRRPSTRCHFRLCRRYEHVPWLLWQLEGYVRSHVHHRWDERTLLHVGQRRHQGTNAKHESCHDRSADFAIVCANVCADCSRLGQGNRKALHQYYKPASQLLLQPSECPKRVRNHAHNNESQRQDDRIHWHAENQARRRHRPGAPLAPAAAPAAARLCARAWHLQWVARRAPARRDLVREGQTARVSAVCRRRRPVPMSRAAFLRTRTSWWPGASHDQPLSWGGLRASLRPPFGKTAFDSPKRPFPCVRRGSPGAGAKGDKAASLGVDVWSEADFLAALGGGGSCGGVYDSRCDNKGAFRPCKAGAHLSHSHSSCVYEKTIGALNSTAVHYLLNPTTAPTTNKT